MANNPIQRRGIEYKKTFGGEKSGAYEFEVDETTVESSLC